MNDVRSHLVLQASLAARRARAAIGRLPMQFCSDPATGTRAHRKAIEDETAALERHLGHLAVLCARLDLATGAALAQAWREFFVAYEDLLDDIHETRCRLSRSLYWEELGAACTSVTPPRIPLALVPRADQAIVMERPPPG